MFCAPGLVFGGTDGVSSYFPVLRARTHFRRYRGRRLPFSCFARPDSFAAVLRASGPVFMFCIPGLVFSGIESVESRILVLCSLTRFRRYRGRQLPFSSFARTDSFLAVPRASGHVLRATGPVFMFCAPGLVFGGTEGVGSRFHILRSQTRFRRYGGRRVPFSCFARPNSFSAETRVPGTAFIFCAPGVVSCGTEGIECRFHVLRSRTRFRRYRGHRVPFSCFARPYSFPAVPRTSGLIFIFCAPGLIFIGTEGVGSRFHVCAPRLIFDGTKGVSSRFPVLLARTRFRRYRGHRVPFSSSARPDSFSAVPTASGPVFMFCAPGLIFGGAECDRSRFLVLRARTHFRRSRG
jgi:hypothetical protein